MNPRGGGPTSTIRDVARRVHDFLESQRYGDKNCRERTGNASCTPYTEDIDRVFTLGAIITAAAAFGVQSEDIARSYFLTQGG